MKHKSRFRKEENVEHIHLEKQSTETAKNFESVEDLLRFDASETEVPPGLRDKLRDSIRREPKRSLWNRIFGGGE